MCYPFFVYHYLRDLSRIHRMRFPWDHTLDCGCQADSLKMLPLKVTPLYQIKVFTSSRTLLLIPKVITSLPRQVTIPEYCKERSSVARVPINGVYFMPYIVEYGILTFVPLYPYRHKSTFLMKRGASAWVYDDFRGALFSPTELKELMRRGP